MAFPSKKEIELVLKRLEKVEGTLALPANPTPLQQFRWDICQNFIKYKRTHNYTQKQIADVLDIDEPKISKILHHRIDEFSTDRLITLYEKLNPELKLKIG